MEGIAQAPLEIDPERWAKLPAAARTALVRSDTYRALAAGSLYFDDASLKTLWDTIPRILVRAADLPTHAATFDKLRQLQRFNSSTVQQFNFEHDRVFGHTISSDCPPYETQYGAGIIFAQTQRMGDISAFYRAFGVQVSPAAHERHDHIAAELEFMSLMAFREATAIIENGQEHLAAVRQAERKFLVEHLAPWALSFAERLGRKARVVAPSDGGFYAALAACLDALFRNELRFADVTPESVGQVEPAKVDYEPEGCSFACGPVGEPVLANLPGFNV